MQLACTVQIPTAFGGIGGAALYIDTEGCFIPERANALAEHLIVWLRQVATAGNDQKRVDAAAMMTPMSLMQNIHVYRVRDYEEHLLVLKESLPKFLAEHREVCLIVVDSVSFPFRYGFDDMALRSRLLTGLAQDYLELASRFDLAVVFLNQVTTKLSPSGQLVLAPALGDSWAHSCTHRIVLHWEPPGTALPPWPTYDHITPPRYATLVKSARYPPGSGSFMVTRQGVRDAPSARRHADQPQQQQQQGHAAAAGAPGMQGGYEQQQYQPQQH